MDLFWTTHFVDLSTDFHCKLPVLPVFLLVKFDVDQGANAVVEFRAESDCDCHLFSTLQDSYRRLRCEGC